MATWLDEVVAATPRLDYFVNLRDKYWRSVVRKVTWRLLAIHNKVYNSYLYNFRFAFTKAFHKISEMPVLPRSFLCDER